jgi:hypothetical protein
MRIDRNSLGIVVVYLKKFVYYIGINELSLLSFTCRKMLEFVELITDKKSYSLCVIPDESETATSIIIHPISLRCKKTCILSFA